MKQVEKRLSIPSSKGMVSGALRLPSKKPVRGGIVIAHGAGNDMDFPLLVRLARESAGAGWAALRFNFSYREGGRRSPDRQEVLEESWRGACEVMQASVEGGVEILVGAGKSLGGRVASQAAARGELPVDALVFLGYPLHSPGKKDRPRDAHLCGIRVPMLFFAGTRDSLCDLDTLRGVLGRLGAPWELEIVEGGDHSFRVPKREGVSEEEVESRIAAKTVRWLEGRFG